MFAISYNDFHNILRLFDVLTNFPFTTSETMRCETIITYKHYIYELPRELSNNLGGAAGGAFVPTQEKKKTT